MSACHCHWVLPDSFQLSGLSRKPLLPKHSLLLAVAAKTERAITRGNKKYCQAFGRIDGLLRLTDHNQNAFFVESEPSGSRLQLTTSASL